jgi:hypothetical protein
MADSAGVALRLLCEWLPGGTQEIMERGIGADAAERLLVFLAAAHDLGKATPLFQLNPNIGEDLRSQVLDAGFPQPPITGNDWRRVKHSLASQAILERYGVDRSVAVVLGGHHGKPPSAAGLAISAIRKRTPFSWLTASPLEMAQTSDGDPIFDVTQSEKRKFQRQGKTVTFEAAVFEGVLRIVDAELLVNAMKKGIGREKAYGCGLLTLARQGDA